MYWEDEWECGDGCCSGCGEWVINFQEMVDEHVRSRLRELNVTYEIKE